MNMERVKPFKSLEEQVEILKSRGLIIEDTQFAISTLKYINYYRLSAYSLTLRSNDKFTECATFENVMQLYNFDGDLRNCLMKYCSIVEVSFRTYISYVHSKKYGPLGYMKPGNFADPWYHAEFLSKCKKYINYSKEPYIMHHKNDLNGVYPLWVIVETINFDVLSKLFKNLKSEDKNYISNNYYNLSREYVESWLKGCVDTRNICAHGGRLYNKSFSSNKVRLGEKIKEIINDDSVFAKIYGLFMLLPNKVLKKSLIDDLDKLFCKYPFAEPRYLGMPEIWKEFLMKYLVPDDSAIINKVTVT